MDQDVFYSGDRKRIESHILDNRDEIVASAHMRLMRGMGADEVDPSVLQLDEIQVVNMPMGLEKQYHVMLSGTTPVPRTRIVGQQPGPGGNLKQRGYEDIKIEAYANIRVSDVGVVTEADIISYIE